MRYLLIALFLLGGCAQADETADAGHDALKARFAKAFAGMEIVVIEDSPLAGLVEVQLNNGEWLFATPDGEFVLAGDLYRLKPEGGVVNMGEQKLAGVRKEQLALLDPDDMISYVADDPKADVYVFTDTSCGYCRKLHQHMAEYNAMGVSIHYLAFPRGGMDRPNAQTMRAVWCAKDRQSAMTEAKLRSLEATPPPSCKDPVAWEYQLGIDLGVRGTPAIYTPEGESIGGYLSPEDMAAALGLKAPKS